MSLLTIVLLALLISATVMYSAEHEAQPKTFGSIPQALWWSVATLTTVGYGDIYPVTVLGRICASFIMLLGIGLVALPTGLLGSAMYELLTLKNCPHCGADLRPLRPTIGDRRTTDMLRGTEIWGAGSAMRTAVKPASATVVPSSRLSAFNAKTLRASALRSAHRAQICLTRNHSFNV